MNMLTHEVRNNNARADQLRAEVEAHIANGGHYEQLPPEAVSGASLAFNNRSTSKVKAIFCNYDDEE